MIFNNPDYWKQDKIFPKEFRDILFTCIGAGSSGSWTIMNLAKLGVKKIIVWDPDKINPHNLPNSIYYSSQVGQYKVDALKKILKKCEPNVEIITHKELFDFSPVSGIFITTIDNMAGRREIWEKTLKDNYNIQFYVDTRIGAEGGHVRIFKPYLESEYENYENTLYSDEDAFINVCNQQYCAPTAMGIASIATWAIINRLTEKRQQPETLISFTPRLTAFCKNFT